MVAVAGEVGEHEHEIVAVDLELHRAAHADGCRVLTCPYI
jgi:hypothetical protein